MLKKKAMKFVKVIKISIKNQKKYVLNNEGFTLLDALMGMFVMMFLLTLMTTLILMLKDNYYENINQRETVMFIMQVQDDLLETQSMSIEDDHVRLTFYNKDEITYEQDDEKLIRKVNDDGYEVLVSNLKDSLFWIEDDILYFEFIFKNDKTVEGVLGNEIKI